MKLLFGLNQLGCIQKNTALTIGNFDGVHLGHQALLRKLVSEAKKRQLTPVVLLFEPQPAEYFSSGQTLARLSSLREKLILMTNLGIDTVCCVRFNHFFANIESKIFIQDIILKRLNTKFLLLGHDFRFGQGKRGDIALLKRELLFTPCTVEIYSDFLHEDERISSTNIRHFLSRGHFAEAQNLLGRLYSITGRVVAGDARARQWGFPTANIHLCRKTSPLQGVYCVCVKRDKQSIEAVANIGYRPTIDGHRLVLEVHLFDFSDTLYGERLEVIFLHQLRQEQRFASIDALVLQIGEDVKTARNYFDRRHKLA